MKTIIAGPRFFLDYAKLEEAVASSNFMISSIISGGAKGADSLGERYAKENNIPLTIFEAQWDKYGRAAGAKRNIEMALEAEALIAIWDCKSKGTGNMIFNAKKLGLKVYVCSI